MLSWPPDVHHHPGGGVEIGGPPGVAGDLGDLLVSLLQQIPALADGDGESHLWGVELVIQGEDTLPRVGGGGQDGGPHNLSSVKEGSFGGGGAGINSQCQPGAPLTAFR